MVFELWDCKFDLDMVAYTPEEFDEKKVEFGVVSEAVKKGSGRRRID
jgi:hypothetical protein